MPQTFADALGDLLRPMFYDDPNQSNALDIYLGAIGDGLFQLVEDWASDTDDGKPGYSLLVDANRCPDDAIMWLAQFVGAKITTGTTAAAQREQLLGLGNWKRGTVAALQAAPIPYLTGSQFVQVKERDTSAYHFQVTTYLSETPDSNAVLAALIAQKPAGLVMNYVVFSGQKAFTMRDSIMRGTTPDSLRLDI